jgi:pSer/pThr/pTyr-binding forkhead associated (FHA) protein
MAQITINNGSNSHTETLTAERTTIGRAPDNKIVLDDVSVSTHHAEIICRKGQFLLRDLGSSNGTNVNGQSVIDVPLNDRDIILFGSVACVFGHPLLKTGPARDSIGTEFVFECDLCGQSLLAGEELIGTQTTCAGCHKRIIVPANNCASLKAATART